ncbi:GGDEF domain-containing protein [Pseudomonas sp. W17]|uniref:diguanylate cyclase n=2 Tax=Pseudomonas TaxID=286 RepID=A0AAU7WST2_9PSED
MVNGERMLIECQRRCSPMTLLLCDLDHFKRLNDAYGHQTGDQVLVAFSQVLAETLGTKDVFARIGGEEFTCLLAATDEQAAWLLRGFANQRDNCDTPPKGGK